MMKRAVRLLAIVGAVLSVSSASEADVIGTLEQTAPLAQTYVFDAVMPGDFNVVGESPTGSVTATLDVLDVNIDPTDPANSNTSGCEASDFAGFVDGSIALIQRGTCTFEQKALNAQQAGAVGVLIFNEGQAGRTDATFATLGTAAGITIPVLSLSFALGESLYNQTLTGPVTMSMSVVNTPEPATMSLLVFGLGALAVRRRRIRPHTGR